AVALMGPMSAGRTHGGREGRPHHLRHRPGAARSAASLRLRRGATDHRLTRGPDLEDGSVPHRRSKNHDKRVLVVGLGRFGSSLALELMNHDWEVLALDSHPRLVQSYADALTHAVVGDAT